MKVGGTFQGLKVDIELGVDKSFGARVIKNFLRILYSYPNYNTFDLLRDPQRAPQRGFLHPKLALFADVKVTAKQLLLLLLQLLLVLLLLRTRSQHVVQLVLLIQVTILVQAIVRNERVRLGQRNQLVQSHRVLDRVPIQQELYHSLFLSSASLPT